MANKQTFEDIARLNKQFDKAAFGFDPSKQDTSISDLENKVKENLRAVNSYKLTGEESDIVAFFDKVMYRNRSGKGLKTGRNVLNRSSSFIDEVERGEINLFYGDESNRFMRYKSIKAICEMIPELARAVGMYRDMIISPNSFSGDTIHFDVINTGSDDYAIEDAQDELKKLDEKYKVSQDFIPKIVGSVVQYGDSFTVVMNFKDEIDKMIENGQMYGSESATIVDEYKGDSLASEDVKTLDSLYNIAQHDHFEKHKKMESEKYTDKTFTSADWEQEIDKFMNVQINPSVAEGLFADEYEIYKELRENADFATESTGKSQMEMNLAGSIIRQLDANKTIKVEIGGTCVGYYYLDITFNPASSDPMDTDPYSCPACDLTYTTNRIYSFMNHANSGMMARDNRLQAMTDIFAKRLAAKMNRKFIAKNHQFRDFIYTMLKANRSINRTAITFIPPKNMVHIKKGSYTYGESILDPVLYFAKLYVLSILAAIMQQVINGKDKTVYYIETGLDEDSEGAVNSFIADLKGREVTLDDLSDVTAMFNRITKANSMYIPVVDGKKAVEFDTFAGQEAQLNNDFLEFLKRSVVNGSGIPASLLDSMSDVEFATTLIMQNGNVQKQVIAYQQVCNAGLTEIYRKLADNEASPIKFIFEAKFSDPTILDNRKAEEEIGKVQSITEFVTNTIYGEQPSEEDEKSKPEFKKQVAMKLMPQLDWKDYDEIFRKVKENTKATDLSNERNVIDSTDTSGGEGEESGSGGSWG